MASSDKAGLLIRALQPQYAAQAAKIWVDGLQQTIDQIDDAKRKEEIANFFKDSAEKECADGGCVGPHGEGLVEFWCQQDTDVAESRCMFVAVRDEKVLGLVGVKRGMDYTKFPSFEDHEEYGTFSVWKMSVAERRVGVGRKLMQAVEDWVRQQQGSQRIRLYTGNPIAATFYMSLGFVIAEEKEHYGVYEKILA